MSRARWVYAFLDVLLAALYLLLFLKLVPSRSSVFTAVAIGVSTLLVAGGAGLVTGSRWGRALAATSSIVMLVACFTLILLLAWSAAYLHGIYDGIGEAGVAFSILAALLAVEVVGLVPALQLAHLWRTRSRESR